MPVKTCIEMSTIYRMFLIIRCTFCVRSTESSPTSIQKGPFDILELLGVKYAVECIIEVYGQLINVFTSIKTNKLHVYTNSMIVMHWVMEKGKNIIKLKEKVRSLIIS